MLAEEGADVRSTGSPTPLQALIAARIDRLPPATKAVLQRAAVIGRVFWGGAIERARRRTRRRRARRSRTSCCATSSLREARSSISRRAGVPLQARPDPRGRLLGPVQVARAPSYHARFAAWLQRAGRRGAARDPRLPPRPGGDAASPSSTARRRPSSRARRPQRSRRRAGARSRARRTGSARKLLPARRSSSSRRSSAATGRARRLAARRHPGGLARDGARARRRRRGGRPLHRGPRADRARRGRAAPATRDVPRARGADRAGARAARRRTTVGRFDALEVRAHVALVARRPRPTSERYAEQALELARRAGRKDLEARRATSSASVYLSRLELDARRGADRAGARAGRGERQRSTRAAWRSRAARGQLAPRAASSTRPRRRSRRRASCFAEAGARAGARRALNLAARVGRRRQGDIARAESCSARRSASLEAARRPRRRSARASGGSPSCSLEQGKVEEAERFALEAREMVGPHDVTSRVDDAARARARPRGAGPRRGGRAAVPRGDRGARADRARRAGSSRSGARGVPARARPRDEAAAYEARLRRAAAARREPSRPSTAPIA